MSNRVLSGMRPTGKLHIGHFVGALDNWIELQNNYESFFFVADWHALTTTTASEKIKQDTFDMVRDWIYAGVDPEKSTIFIQSQVPEHAELHLAFSMINNLGRLERLPTFKGLAKEVLGRSGEEEDLTQDDFKEAKGHISYGFLGYPVLQSADILLYKADAIPVGEDQLCHLELTREIAHKFNTLYGETFPQPEGLLTASPKLVGTDGRKMSKSYDNTVLPYDSGKTLLDKLKKVKSDPSRQTISDPGNPEECAVYDLHYVFSSDEKLFDVSTSCKNATRGCFDCKKLLGSSIEDHFEDYVSRRETLNLSTPDIRDILYAGSQKAREIAQETMHEVKEKMSLLY